MGELLAAGLPFTLVKLTPAHLTGLQAYLDERARHARAACFVVGGEALPEAAANFWCARVPGLRIVNEYGPTEAVVGCCIYSSHATRGTNADLPIGRPAGNIRLYVLDERIEAVPPGIAGKLYIGGAQLARGYVHQPDMTAARSSPIRSPFRSAARAHGSIARVIWRDGAQMDSSSSSAARTIR